MRVIIGQNWARITLVLIVVLCAAAVVAQGLPVPKVTLGVENAKNPNQVSSSLQIVALLTILSLAPAILILTTAFTRIVIVLSMLRTALGTPSIPPNQIVIGLSLFLTFFVMAPTYDKVQASAIKPYLAGKLTEEQAIQRAQAPMREFMLKNTYSKDLKLFLDIRGEKATAENVSLVSLVPAFVISELKTAFIIGFYLFVPFVIIDLIVAGILMSMGMMMMPPVVVSLPAKLLVFILADGWSLLVNTIMAGYR